MGAMSELCVLLRIGMVTWQGHWKVFSNLDEQQNYF